MSTPVTITAIIPGKLKTAPSKKSGWKRGDERRKLEKSVMERRWKKREGGGNETQISNTSRALVRVAQSLQYCVWQRTACTSTLLRSTDLRNGTYLRMYGHSYARGRWKWPTRQSNRGDVLPRRAWAQRCRHWPRWTLLILVLRAPSFLQQLLSGRTQVYSINKYSALSAVCILYCQYRTAYSTSTNKYSNRCVPSYSINSVLYRYN